MLLAQLAVMRSYVTRKAESCDIDSNTAKLASFYYALESVKAISMFAMPRGSETIAEYMEPRTAKRLLKKYRH